MVNSEDAKDFSKEPLILTLWIDAPSQEYFNSLRRKYYPPDKSYLDAHLTLFHALPGEYHTMADIKEAVRTINIFDMEANSIVSLGKGTAVKINSAHLVSVHRRLQKRWSNYLTNQDKQSLWPHITIQNKVAPVKAAEAQAILNNTFLPFSFTALGLKLWRYLGGPWELLNTFEFNVQ